MDNTLSMSADATCSTMESYSNSSARVPESSGNREDRLQRRRERERARRASETAEQREEQLERAHAPIVREIAVVFWRRHSG